MGRAADVRGPRLKPEERMNALHKTTGSRLVTLAIQTKRHVAQPG
jgi:hypothetical protein